MDSIPATDLRVSGFRWKLSRKCLLGLRNILTKNDSYDLFCVKLKGSHPLEGGKKQTIDKTAKKSKVNTLFIGGLK